MHLSAIIPVVSLPFTVASSLRFAAYARRDIALRHGRPLAPHRRWPKLWIAAQRWFGWLRWSRIAVVASAWSIACLADIALSCIRVAITTGAGWCNRLGSALWQAWKWCRRTR